ncbi:hypothetical protein MMC28_003247 [Mycoblastus sanguinarius]|nr:hypothetical protein [Mycoblastus sanguinarius]
MPPPSPLPKHLYKILPEPPPHPLPVILPLSDLDLTDGFIHLSTADQTPATAALFFSTTDTLWLLKIPLEGIEANVQWEEGSSGCFAHLYGLDLGRDKVDSVKKFERGRGEQWGGVIGGDRWIA